MDISDLIYPRLRKRAAIDWTLKAAAVSVWFTIAFLLYVPGQSSTGTLSGSVIDPSGLVVPGARVSVTDVITGFTRSAVTNRDGQFTFAFLPVARYTVVVQSNGFATATVAGVELNASDQKKITVKLSVGGIAETVEVLSEDAGVHSGSASVSTVVDRKTIEAVPLNGRSFISLVALAPGVLLTKSDSTNQGQFSVNGQRADSNNVTVDGVSANIGANSSYTLGGTVPATNAVGSTAGLVSLDAVEELNVQTSAFAPEFGRFSGGQVSVVTRSGTNRFNGSLFEYFRNDALDANDWFANREGLEKAPLRHNDFGGVFGGPILRDRSFFFFSYEGLRLRQPGSVVTTVPTTSLRQSTPEQLRPLLDAFPIPNGEELTPSIALFRAVYSDPRTMDAFAIRLDHRLTAGISIFGRYNYAPSYRSERRGGSSLSVNTVRKTSFSTITLTVGSIQVIGRRSVNDFRINRSTSDSFSVTNLDDFGGAVRPADSLLFPAPFSSPEDSSFSFSVDGATFGVSSLGNKQRQLNIVDNFSYDAGAHQLRFGIDFRRLTPVTKAPRYSQSITTDSTRLTSSMASRVRVASVLADVLPIYTNFSAYAQDLWSVDRKLTLTYGLRWELNPPPIEKNGNYPYTTVGGDDPDEMIPVPRREPFWETRYTNFAPRVGAAYLISRKPGFESVARAGFGVFYDLAMGTASTALRQTSFPFSGTRTHLNVPIPLPESLATPPAFNLDPPYTEIWLYDRDMRTPRTYQWSAGVQQSLGDKHKLNASYVASAGRSLISDQFLVTPNPNFFRLHLVRDTGSSDYRSLQLQFEREPVNGLAAIVSYTLARSVDTSSNDSSFLNTADEDELRLDRGPSDFDVRHSVSAAVTYEVPRVIGPRPLAAIINGWTLSSMITVRSATPITNIEANNTVWEDWFWWTDCDRFGNSMCPRPDLIPGAPVYLYGSQYPGGKRLNPSAFATPPPGRQGTLGRNALRGFPAFQVDMSLRREFKLREKWRLQIAAEAFNVFNHPNFADPNGTFYNEPELDFYFFGLSTQMLGSTRSSVGSSGEAGLNPIYQLGTPRSVQLSIRIRF